MDYKRYIASNAWRARRLRFIATTKGRCPCGARDNLHVHHATYERMGSERDEDLRLVCERCHSEIHAIHSKIGGDLASATDRVLALISEANKPAKAQDSKPKTGTSLPWEIHVGVGHRPRYRWELAQ